MSQFSFEQKIEILSKMALDYCNENGLKFKQYNQKLAELIVRECCDRLLNDSDLTDIRTRRCVASIQQHFGFK